MMKSTLNYLLIAFNLLFTSTIFAQSGTIDESFGNKGEIITSFGNGNAYSFASTVQADGKILLAGYATDTTAPQDFAVVRYNSEGSYDTTFGNKGRVKTDFDNTDDVAYAITLQKDGKILVVGKTSMANAFGGDFALVRYNIDGSLDKSFGLNGKVTTDLGDIDIAYSVAIQSNGKIVAAGIKTNPASQGDFALVRYNIDGIIDSSFGSFGFALTDLGGTNDIGKSIAIQIDDKIVFGGTKNFGSNNQDFALLRYKSDGSLDSSFSSDGVEFIDFGATADYGNSVVIQHDGKIIIEGTTLALSYNTKIGMARFAKNGAPDNSFGTNSKVNIELPNTSLSNQPSVIALTSNETIVALAQNVDLSFVVVRYQPNGLLDSTFGQKGVAVFSKNNGLFPYGLTIQQDDKNIATGIYLESVGAYGKMLTLRINNENTLPITLSSFSATKKQSSILLSWQTTSEQNNAYFAIERSNNGNTDFKEIGRVTSKGNPNQIQQYSFEDFSPLRCTNYYRLKPVDKDGKTTYSKTVFVDFDKATLIKLYPNPVKDVLTLEGGNANIKTTISIIDLQGNVLAKTSTTNSTYTWNIKQLPAGNYYVRVEADKKVTTMKFVKE